MVSDDKPRPWIGAINRLLRAELRPDPRPKPHKPSHSKYWLGQDLVAAAGIRANTLSDVLNGKRDPTMDTLRRIADALGVPPAMLLMDEAESSAYAQFRQNVAATTHHATVEETALRLIQEHTAELQAATVEAQMTVIRKALAAPKPLPAPPAATRPQKRRA